MKITPLIFILWLTAGFIEPSFSQFAVKSLNANIDSAAVAICNSLTLEEKIGQMTQLNLPTVLKHKDGKVLLPIEIDSVKLREALFTFKVGSFLNTGGSAHSLKEWHYIVNTLDHFTMSDDASGIPIIYGIDAIHGANYVSGSVIFPHQLGQAATWNDSLIFRAAQIAAYETRAASLRWVFSPVLDVARQPLWSQFFETFGEDVYATERFGKAMIRGYQNNVAENANVAATAKHFIGYGYPISGKDRTPVDMSEVKLREYFLPPFQMAADAGVKAIMVGSNELNGVPLHANPQILDAVLREELGFDGLLISDWGDVEKLHLLHRISSSNKESTKLAIDAGIDMVMVPMDFQFTRDLLALVSDGSITESRINESAKRIIKLKLELGLFEKSKGPKMEDYPDFGGEEHYKVAYNLAAESITLLENKSKILPLSADTRILLTGPAANSKSIQHGSWSRTWQGTDTKIENDQCFTLLDGMKRHFNHLNYAEGCNIDSITDLKRAVSMAKGSDVIIVALGEHPSTEKPGDIEDLSISLSQRQFIESMLSTGKPVVLVLMENRPQIISSFADRCAAIILAYQPGCAGADALSDIIVGKVNPSGKLPFTYPRNVNGFNTYDHKFIEKLDVHYGMNGFNPQWEFGRGLSYTNFQCDKPVLNSDTFSFTDTISLQLLVTNTGDRSGKEVILVFISDEVASISPPVKRLREFLKVDLMPHESENVEFKIPVSRLAFVGGQSNRWLLEPGWYSISVNGNSVRFYLDN